MFNLPIFVTGLFPLRNFRPWQNHRHTNPPLHFDILCKSSSPYFIPLTYLFFPAWNPKIQIIGYIIVRNIFGSLRKRFSLFFAWIGRISLEVSVCGIFWFPYWKMCERTICSGLHFSISHLAGGRRSWGIGFVARVSHFESDADDFYLFLHITRAA